MVLGYGVAVADGLVAGIVITPELLKTWAWAAAVNSPDPARVAAHSTERTNVCMFMRSAPITCALLHFCLV